ncbi:MULTISPECIES: hypothetical protein [Acinetobacter]|jgi:hypothetical protein|uniref:Uncharacterized protein n=2 Tax=Acinetobacter baumannii TaxID=470 RepID=A0AAJ0VMF6_ACIBA|nr:MULTISPECIES: hypothetical protein [Acinetobacter]SSW75213.1 Uncharacterised protein [Klebsiella pneumoniae]EHF3479146.1 hypothetical protein [Acinetobacter baumannii]EHU1300129.1 hypothetical protein [Acinetobacter baumannii]EHU2820113.1 hypothetical protein [Acinetobacter baumannii]EHU2824644.1 hypothetical protein [Acinetobacter baumannii]
MSRICCPICGSDEVTIVDQHNPTKTTTQRRPFPKPPMQSLLHYVVNYAAMGASGARMIRGQRPIIFVIGALVGGAIGCAACLLNHVHEQTPDSTLKESPLPQTLYQCLECEHHFALSYEQGRYGFKSC